MRNERLHPVSRQDPEQPHMLWVNKDMWTPNLR